MVECVEDVAPTFGKGLFTTILVEEGRALFVDEHLQKLDEQIHSLQLPPLHFHKPSIEELIQKKRATKGRHRLRIIYTGSDLMMTLTPLTERLPKELSLTLYPEPIVTPLARYKSLCLWPRFLVKEYAENEGFDDALTLSPEGYLLEAAFANIFWVEGDKLYTPSPDLPLYFGTAITRIVKEGRYKVIYVKCGVEEVGKVAYLVNSLSLLPIKKIGKRRLTPRPFLS